MPYSSDDQSLDCDDDDDDDYDVPPAFQLDLDDVARLSAVTDTDACSRTDGDTEAHTDDNDDDDDDYDVPPAFRLDPCNVVRRSLVVETVAYTTEDGHATRHTNSDDDDDDYDVLPASLHPPTLEAGCPPPFYPDDDDIYDYPMTNTESQLASASLFAQHDQLGGGWSGDAAQRTSTIDPDIDDDMYDYIGTYSDGERQVENPSIGGDSQRVAADKVLGGMACADDFYDYIPCRSSAEGRITHEADGCGNCPMVLQHKRSSSSSSDDHYDMLPSRPASSSSQLSVRKSSVSDSAARSSAATLDSTTDEDCYDFTTSNTVSETAPLCPSASSEVTGAPKDNGEGGCPVPVIAVNEVPQSCSSSNEHYDVLPCHAATSSERLSVRKSSDAFATSTVLTGTLMPTALPPTSRSTLYSSRPGCSSGQYVISDSKQRVNDVTRHTVVTPVMCERRRPADPAENKPSSNSKLTTIYICLPVTISSVFSAHLTLLDRALSIDICPSVRLSNA